MSELTKRLRDAKKTVDAGYPYYGIPEVIEEAANRIDALEGCSREVMAGYEDQLTIWARRMEMVAKHKAIADRLRERARIRRNISTRKSVQEGKPDRLCDLLEEAARALEDAGTILCIIAEQRKQDGLL